MTPIVEKNIPQLTSEISACAEKDTNCLELKSDINQNIPHFYVGETPFDEEAKEGCIDQGDFKSHCNDSYEHDVYESKTEQTNCNGKKNNDEKYSNSVVQQEKSKNVDSENNLYIENSDGIDFKGRPRSVSIDGMLSIVGEYGLFQKIANIMTCIMVLPASFHLVIVYFVADSPSWSCNVNSTLCVSEGIFDKDDRSRCYLPRNEWHYTVPKEYSIITQFDISCKDDWLISLTTTLFFVGWIIGAIVLGWCTDIYGRTKTLFISMVVILTVGLISAFMPSFYSFTVCRFIVGFFSPGTFPQMFIVMSEMVGDKKRPFAGIVVFLFFTVGTCLICVKAYFVRNWKLLYILCTAPYAFVLLFFKFIPESVRYLRVKGKITEAMTVFENIAHWNKKTIPEDVILSQPSSDVTSHKSNPLDLFRTTNLALKTLIQGYIWYACGVVYFGLFLAAGDLDGGLYRDFFLMTVSEIPAVMLIMYLTERFGRKKPTMITMLIGSVSCAVLGFIPKEGHMKIARLILGMVGKCFTTASFDALHTWSIEIYPSNIRGEGMGFLQVTVRIGTACAPWVAKELKRLHPAAPFAVMGAIPFIAFCLMFLLPETKGVATTDSDTELENKISSKKGRKPAEIRLAELA